VDRVEVATELLPVMDTEMGGFMKPEVGDAETEVQPRVQARGGEAGEERGVSAAQGARDLDVHETVLRNG
jgi:hypothetical protein